MSERTSLAGDVAVVTGAGRGIGFAIARRLCADGAAVTILDRDTALAEEAAATLRAEGFEAAAIGVDVSDEQGVAASFADIHARHGSIQILVNAAGIFPKTMFEDLTFADWRRIMSVNLDGTFLCCRAAWSVMQAQGYGRIVNIGSASFRKGNPGYAPYVASKGSITGLTRVLATEGGPHGITANIVAPGVIASDGALQSKIGRKTIEAAIAIQSMKVTGRPSDVADAVAYLVGRDAGFVTGQAIYVDGGSTRG